MQPHRRAYTAPVLALFGTAAAFLGYSLWPSAKHRPSDPAPDLDPIVSVAVDVNADVHPISPLIYGMAFMRFDESGTAAAYSSDIGLAFSRWGGNHTSRYNWELGNATSAAADFQFRNRTVGIGDAVLDAQVAPSSAADHWLDRGQQLGHVSLLTVPSLGWVAKSSVLSDYSISVPDEGGLADPNYGPDGITGYDPSSNQQRTSIASFVRKGSAFAATPDLTDGAVYQDEWLHHLIVKYGTAANGGVSMYAFDNEYDLWHETHRDVHPRAMGYDDLLAKFQELADMVKDQDASAKVAGPVSWGWEAYYYSAKDGFNNNADRAAHGGLPLLAWFLERMQQLDAARGQRTLDMLDVHYYPQASGVVAGNTDVATSALRLRQVRTLWDPSYRDESWQDQVAGGAPLMVLPTLKNWVAAYYPGTGVLLSEWMWGAEATMNGGLAVADVLGVLGRYGIDAAAFWPIAPKGSPAYLAMKLYRNADGAGLGLGDVSVRALSSDTDVLSAYAAKGSDTGVLTMMLIAKDPSNSVTANVSLKGYAAAGNIDIYRVSSAAPSQITSASVVPSASGSFSVVLPPYSMSLLIIGGALSVDPSLPATPGGLTAVAGDGSVALSWQSVDGAAGYYAYQGPSEVGPFLRVNAAPVSQTALNDTGLNNGAAYWFQVSAVNAAGESSPSPAVVAFPKASANRTYVYQDSLVNGWQNWSWAQVNLSNTSPVASGTRSAAVTFGAWQGVYLHKSVQSLAGLTQVELFANGGGSVAGPLALRVVADNGWSPGVTLANYCAGGVIPANAWVRCTVPLSALGSPGTINGLVVQEWSGHSLPTMYFDDIDLSGPVAAEPPDSPTGVAATAADSRVTLSWNPVTTATGYFVYRGTSSAGPFARLNASAVAQTSWVDTAVTNGTTYWYEVTASNAAGESAPTEAVSATPQLSAPVAPTGLVASATASAVALSWDGVAGASGYFVYRGPTQTGSFTRLTATAIATTSYTDTSVTAGNTYWYRVSASNAAGEGPQSGPVSATVLGVSLAYVYQDSLVNGWRDWSWGTTRNFANTNPVQAGTRSIAISYNRAWGGLYLYNPGVSTVGRSTLQIWANGGSTNNPILDVKSVVGRVWTARRLNAYCAGGVIPANAWVRCLVPLSELRATNVSLQGVVVQEGQGRTLPTLYFDEIAIF